MPCVNCRLHDKKVCCLGLTSLLCLPADHFPGEALEHIFKATLDLLVSYKDQVAGTSFCIFLHMWQKLILLLTEAEKLNDAADDMDGFDADEENEEEDSDKEMGDDTEDGDEVDSLELQKLAAEVGRRM
ncbi:hypothetical protein GW17_00032357 [Ensete ventricosum]|nr:hypothetical protein GW17_00032357 [Ensete ventricosum]